MPWKSSAREFRWSTSASTSYFGVQDPMARMATELPELVSAGAHQRLLMQDQLRSLDLQLAGPLLCVALLGGLDAIRLLRRRPWSRALLLSVGLLAIALSGYHSYRSVQITTVEATGVPESEEMLPAFFAVAGINVALQSLPLVLVMSLLRHPIVCRYVSAGRRDAATV